MARSSGKRYGQDALAVFAKKEFTLLMSSMNTKGAFVHKDIVLRLC
jgi:hypothetical protein